MTRTFNIGRRSIVVCIGQPHAHTSRIGRTPRCTGHGVSTRGYFLARNVSIVTITRGA